MPVADLREDARFPLTIPDTANQIGWPQFVATVEAVVDSLPAEQRAHAVILTNDYSEASPLVLLGTGLPPVYSGHNAYWDWGPPPDDRTVVIHVGDWRPADWSSFFIGCHDVATIDNGLGIDERRAGEGSLVVHGAARVVVGHVASAPDDQLVRLTPEIT